MALVICPECGNKISQYADICNQCGFPLQKYLDKNKITDLTKTLICPKCGGYDYICEFTEDNSIYIACEYCHTPYVQTELDAKAFEKNSLHEWQKGNKDFEADMAKKYGNGEFDEDAYRHRKEIIAKRVREREIAKSNHVTQNQQNIPKCPTCQSTNIKKISATSKATNAALFGLFGNKRKKQFHCNNCGYEW